MAKRKLSFSSVLGPIGRHKVISLIVLAVLIVVGIFVYQAVAVRIEKHNFEQARSAIDALYADISKEVGPPDSHNIDGGCGYFRSDFGNSGPLRCSLASRLVYIVSSKDQSDQLTRSVTNVFNAHPELISATPPFNDTSKYLPISEGGPTNKYYRVKGGLYCMASYLYESNSGLAKVPVIPDGANVLDIGIQCAEGAEGII